ncbi:MAG: RNA polymerase subunit sigma [Anaeromyxobacter sp. RBG_16_69_14]|nr:MAG: RNA polymerase subunit sigma [Anaeromyxobacter sp. RBG_16_69_14]
MSVASGKAPDLVKRVATEQSDERLMRRYQAGDVGAFEDLLRRHRTAIHAFLHRLTCDSARAEDLAQETWLRIIAATPRWQRSARFTTWAFSIARNLAVDEARRAVHRAAESLDASPLGEAPLVESLATEAPGPDRGAESALLRPKLEAALAALPMEQREVFVLREYAGVPFAEIAEITSAPVPTVKSRMRYALEALRADLARRGVLPDDAASEGRSALP